MELCFQGLLQNISHLMNRLNHLSQSKRRQIHLQRYNYQYLYSLFKCLFLCLIKEYLYQVLASYIQQIHHCSEQIKFMEEEPVQIPPKLLFQHAKKHPHSHSISSESFSVANKDIVIYNISLKQDPENDFDIANYRRGLTLLQEIIDYKEGPLRVAKKGLRKFFDILPQYISAKNSHISSSKHHIHRKQAILSEISRVKAEQYMIYSTEKANGQNAQISWDQEGGFWVIGSKNKTLLLAQEKDMKYIQHKHEHVRTLSIAEMWFQMLEKNSQNVDNIKKCLSQYTLVGEHCDTVKSGHIIDYGKTKKLLFYSLVQKQGRQYSCESPQKLLQFLEETSLSEYCVKFQIKSVKSYQALIDELRKEVYRINSAKMDDQGEGRVIYLTAKTKNVEHDELQQSCLSVFKLKTLEYRIFRKLRQKIRIYFEKAKRSYDKILNKYIEEVKELIKGFDLPQPEEYYYDIAKKAFQLCDDQGKSVSKFVHNKFVAFLKILQAGPISKQNFMAIVNDSGETELMKFLNEGDQLKATENPQEKMIETSQKAITKKKLMIVIPLTIPSSGKSTIFNKIREFSKQVKIEVLSSDTVRFQVMAEKMKQKKSMSKKVAYQKSRKQANDRYYKYMDNIIKKIAKDTTQQNDKFLLLLDKNHPENAIKPAIAHIRSTCDHFSQQLDVKIVGLFPLCNQLLANKPKYLYPFSSNYILACAKRVLGRQNHQTLEGSESERVNVCVGFANMFRNFSTSDYHIHKYFDFAIKIPLTNQQEKNREELLKLGLEQKLLEIMLSSKPGSFDMHAKMPQFVDAVKQWGYEQKAIEESVNRSIEQLHEAFQSRWNVVHKEQENEQQ